MTLRRRALGSTAIIAVGAVSVILAGCGEEDKTPTEEACTEWRDLLIEDPAPSDDEVADRLDEMLELGPDEPVAGYMVALSARLRDGEDISTTYQRLADACT